MEIPGIRLSIVGIYLITDTLDGRRYIGLHAIEQCGPHEHSRGSDSLVSAGAPAEIADVRETGDGERTSHRLTLPLASAEQPALGDEREPGTAHGALVTDDVEPAAGGDRFGWRFMSGTVGHRGSFS